MTTTGALLSTSAAMHVGNGTTFLCGVRSHISRPPTKNRPALAAPPNPCRGRYSHRVNELGTQETPEPADLLNCKNVDITSERGKIFTDLSTINSSENIKQKNVHWGYNTLTQALLLTTQRQ